MQSSMYLQLTPNYLLLLGAHSGQPRNFPGAVSSHTMFKSDRYNPVHGTLVPCLSAGVPSFPGYASGKFWPDTHSTFRPTWVGEMALLWDILSLQLMAE